MEIAGGEGAGAIEGEGRGDGSQNTAVSVRPQHSRDLWPQ